MANIFYHIVRRPTPVSILTGLFFLYILFLSVYKLFDPPEQGSGYNMILEMLIIFSIVPLVLLIIDRLLIIKINHTRLIIIEAILLVSFFLYYFLVVNPF
ncbi:MAG: hypothetical protein LBE92_01975 [Chryseobacterium sp.]|jgi:hypothetical protein|uniref:hypothetical protein n=1 Tax=Chryseobacterium sp. TaxID=1871047 RepID=UPI00282BDB41|nr:hypothetical protein [Chryseobacterium sp.]MDR2234867.1 hypothetical protein [Chryseobacterium sp.]